MIAGLEGTLEGHGSDFAVVNVGGVSFQVYVPNPASLGAIGERLHLHTYLHLKENHIALYGFASMEELGLFEILIGVTGVGPKAALTMLSAMSSEQLSLAIATGDTDLLTQVPGVGQKMARRLVLELKEKLEGWRALAPVSPGAQINADVLAALKGLGYSTSEAMSAIANIPDSADLSLEDKIRLALQQLGKG